MKLRLFSTYSPAVIESTQGEGVNVMLHRRTEIAIVAAIKAVRTISRIGLAEAKQFVEDLADKGSEYQRDLIVVQGLSDVELKEAISGLRAAGVGVIEVGREERGAFRVSIRKMIGVALDEDQIDLAKDLFILYEKHFAR